MPPISEMESDESRVRTVVPPGDQARRLHPRGRVDDGGSGNVEAAGNLAGSEPVLLPECFQDDVLSDADAVGAHRVVGGGPQQLRGTREEGQELAQAFTVGTR